MADGLWPNIHKQQRELEGEKEKELQKEREKDYSETRERGQRELELWLMTYHILTRQLARARGSKRELKGARDRGGEEILSYQRTCDCRDIEAVSMESKAVFESHFDIVDSGGHRG